MLHFIFWIQPRAQLWSWFFHLVHTAALGKILHLFSMPDESKLPKVKPTPSQKKKEQQGKALPNCFSHIMCITFIVLFGHHTYNHKACHTSEANAVLCHPQLPRGHSLASRPFTEATRDDILFVRLVCVHVRVFDITPCITKHAILPRQTLRHSIRDHHEDANLQCVHLSRRHARTYSALDMCMRMRACFPKPVRVLILRECL